MPTGCARNCFPIPPRWRPPGSVSFPFRRGAIRSTCWPGHAPWRPPERQEEAVWKLRQALALDVRPTFFARAEKLVAELARSVQSNLRQCRIAILGSSTTNLFVPIVRALCLRDRIGAEIYEAPFGSIEQETWDANSGLARFRPGIVMLMTHWRDLALEAVTENESEWVRRFVDDRKAVWRRLSDSFACHIIQPSFDYPAAEAYGHLAGVLPGGRTRVIDLVNLRLREEAPANVSILDVPAAQREVGTNDGKTKQAWSRYRLHPSAEALPALVEAYMSHVRAVLGLSRKVLVTDLDNTLWKGVIGEDGLDGIGLGPDSPEGEAHLHLQRYLLESETPRHPARGLFEEQSRGRSTALPTASAHGPAAGRLSPRSTRTGRTKPRVCGRLRRSCRWVWTVLCFSTTTLWSVSGCVQNCLKSPSWNWVLAISICAAAGSWPNFFTALSLSREDLVRAEQYRVEAQRERPPHSRHVGRGLPAKAPVGGACRSGRWQKPCARHPIGEQDESVQPDDPRYSEAEVRAIAEHPRGWAGAFQMSDRMGNYGLIGVTFCRPADRATRGKSTRG